MLGFLRGNNLHYRLLNQILLKEALKEKRGAEKFDLMNHLKKTYFFNTQTCVCDAAYKLIPGLELKGSTTMCLMGLRVRGLGLRLGFRARGVGVSVRG